MKERSQKISFFLKKNITLIVLQNNFPEIH